MNKANGASAQQKTAPLDKDIHENHEEGEIGGEVSRKQRDCCDGNVGDKTGGDGHPSQVPTNNKKRCRQDQGVANRERMTDEKVTHSHRNFNGESFKKSAVAGDRCGDDYIHMRHGKQNPARVIQMMHGGRSTSKASSSVISISRTRRSKASPCRNRGGGEGRRGRNYHDPRWDNMHEQGNGRHYHPQQRCDRRRHSPLRFFRSPRYHSRDRHGVEKKRAHSSNWRERSFSRRNNWSGRYGCEEYGRRSPYANRTRRFQRRSTSRSRSRSRDYSRRTFNGGRLHSPQPPSYRSSQSFDDESFSSCYTRSVASSCYSQHNHNNRSEPQPQKQNRDNDSSRVRKKRGARRKAEGDRDHVRRRHGSTDGFQSRERRRRRRRHELDVSKSVPRSRRRSRKRYHRHARRHHHYKRGETSLSSSSAQHHQQHNGHLRRYDSSNERRINDHLRNNDGSSLAVAVSEDDDIESNRDEGSSSVDERDDDVGHFRGGPGTLIDKRYEIVKDVGLGTFGRVVECMDLRHSASYKRKQLSHQQPQSRSFNNERRIVAIKVVRDVKRYYESALIEADILEDVNSRGGRGLSLCVRMLNRFQFDRHYCMVFECLGRSLYDYLKGHDFLPFPLYCVQDFAHQLLDALDFFHGFQLIHTDLKPENILLVSNAESSSHRRRKSPTSGSKRRSNHRQTEHTVPSSTKIKVIDFGGATYDYEKKSTVINTRQYRAPEVITEVGWSMPSDLWSAGCILSELYTGELLFATHDNVEHLALIERAVGFFPRDLLAESRMTRTLFDACGKHRGAHVLPPESQDHVRRMSSLSRIVKGRDRQSGLQQLLEGLLTISPMHRITAAEALKLPFCCSSL